MKPQHLAFVLSIGLLLNADGRSSNLPQAGLSISATDSQKPDRVASSNGKLQMIGEGRRASLYATYVPAEQGPPNWVRDGMMLGSRRGHPQRRKRLLPLLFYGDAAAP